MMERLESFDDYRMNLFHLTTFEIQPNNSIDVVETFDKRGLTLIVKKNSKSNWNIWKSSAHLEK